MLNRTELFNHISGEFPGENLSNLRELLAQNISDENLLHQVVLNVEADRSAEPFGLLLACLEEGELLSYDEWII